MVLSFSMSLRTPKGSMGSMGWIWKCHYFLGFFATHSFSILYLYSYGLRMPNEAFFHWNSKVLGLGRQIGQINFGAFGVFSAKLSAPILVLSMFSMIQPLFLQKSKPINSQPKIYLGLGFEFWPQRIRDLAFVCL